eukprot:GILI01003409.1.p1 GENE.GILI01003409.1~~GILI01003409.1.p1  ORF type:complete len:554 (+),score=90.82 GILI01003409.1:209-1870(+)
MRWLHLNIVEGFLGPKAASSKLRAYVKYTRSVNGVPETPETGPESDVSQRKAHGYHLWSDPRKFEIPESNQGQCRIDLEVHANNVIRDDETLASGCISEAFVSQLINDNPGYVKEFDVALTPTKEFAYSNDDGGTQEVYNYRVRVRVLITPAGYEPTEEHKSQLSAPSQHFDPKEEKEGDENNEIGLIDTAQALQTELSRWPVFRAIKLIIFAIIALATGVMTIVALIQEVNKQTDPAWHTSNPEEGKRCVRMFDKAKELADAGLAFPVLYNYNLQNTTVAFCTNKTREEIDEKFGSYASSKFDAALDVLGPDCALDGPNRAAIIANCEPQSTCGTALDNAPRPFGVMLGFEIAAPSNQTIFNAKCASVVTSLDDVTTINWPSCGETNVFVYREVRSAIVYLLFIFSFVFCWVRLVMELVGVLNYHNSWCLNCGPERSEAYLFRIAFRGFFGPLYYLFLMAKTGSTHLPIVNDPPLAMDIVLFLCEAVPNVALPIYAIVGCSNANGLMLLLLIFGIVKVVILIMSKIATFVLRATAKEEKVRPDEVLEIKPAM